MSLRAMILVTFATPILAVGCYHELVSAGGGAFTAVTGDGQLGVVDGTLPIPLRVRLTDRDNLPVPNRTVTFTAEPGSGTVSPTTVVTGLDGEAATSWTLGSAAGNQRVRAVVDNLPSVNFEAIAVFTLFDIDVRFLSTPTQSQRTAFEAAAIRWRRVITGDMTDVTVNAPAGQCGANSPAMNEVVDDIVILVNLEQIDGPSGSLGQAGPCFIRTSNSLPLVGRMRLDVADLNALEESGNLNEVILHEMGHVLGIGTLWVERNLLADPVELGGTDPHFTGPLSIAAFDRAGGRNYQGGEKVPVENTGGGGTSDGHWRESVLREELMTGFLNFQQRNPLSDVTIASLQDIGYAVSDNAADTFVITLQPGAAISAGATIPLGNDTFRGPVFRVTSDGKLVAVRGAP